MARKQLKDSAGVNFYPYSDLESVIDNNGNTLSALLSDRLKYVLLSQAEYDSLATKDSGTLYLIQNVVTYSVTSTYSGNISSDSYYTINDGERVTLSFPLTVSEEDKFYCFIIAPKGSQPVVSMGGNTVRVTMHEPGSWYFSISSVTGDIVISD